MVGAVLSLLIEPVPAANPSRPLPSNALRHRLPELHAALRPLAWTAGAVLGLYAPLVSSVRALLRSRPLALSVLGIAFFTFVVAFMRATVYMLGESHVPPWTERQTSTVVGMSALGIGLGSPLAGYLSGGKVELGLVPLGALGMILFAAVGALTLPWLPGLVACIILIGFFTGFFILPLYTLLQHRAPKTSKGDAIATSNFLNVTGAIAASLLFYVLVTAAQLFGF